ncbi:GerAB/ArcD/ProY family transporter [Sulfobacillus sp. hq2]|uniref:GerAB/ArcD/ProY family transporter n=1 Tax=Sulfobacillus TaxID=28033 RepID=UPI0013047FE5|nr:GerAB/ArcD/ProY family transporter [Sulfobacillus sp. hq2]
MPHHIYRANRVTFSQSMERMGLFEFLMVILAAYASGGIYVWPRSLCQMAGQNGTIALLLSGLWAVLVFGGVAYWALKAPGQNAYQKLESTVGNVLAASIAIATGLMTAAYLALISALYISVLTTVVIPGHRAWSLGVVLVIYVFWLSTRPPISVVRMFTITIPGLTVLTLITAVLGFHNMQFPNALRPHFPIALKPVAMASVSGTFFWIPIMPTATAIGMMRKAVRARAVGVTLWGTGLQIALLVVLYVLAVSTLGPQGVAHSTWPIVFVFENIDLSNFFISEIGFGVAIIWTVSFMGFIGWHIWHQGLLLDHLHHGKPSQSKVAVAVAIVMVGAMVLEVSFNPAILEHLLLVILAPINFVGTSLWVSTLVLITWRKGRRQSSQARSLPR